MMEIDFVRSRFVKHFDGMTGNVYATSNCQLYHQFFASVP